MHYWGRPRLQKNNWKKNKRPQNNFTDFLATFFCRKIVRKMLGDQKIRALEASSVDLNFKCDLVLCAGRILQMQCKIKKNFGSLAKSFLAIVQCIGADLKSQILCNIRLCRLRPLHFLSARGGVSVLEVWIKGNVQAGGQHCQRGSMSLQAFHLP